MLFRGKAIILLGPRQVGKTTLLKKLFPQREDILWLNGDEMDVQAFFANASATRIEALLGNRKILVLDEAQRIENIGIRLKLITDEIPHVQLMAIASSSFSLSNKINEPLTGRKRLLRMFPFTFGEMVQHQGLMEEKRMLPHRLVYGYYPEVVMNPGDERTVLKEISESYLYNDLLSWEQISKPDRLLVLLQALALQVGSQVSYHELGQLTGLDSKTVEKYIQILEQAFVIFRLQSFSRNLRNELKQSKKIYFYDNGIRNAILANFSQIELRTDIGALWENFFISERLKFNASKDRWVNSWFWRTREQNEIDLLEESEGKLHAFECKWRPVQKDKIPRAFTTHYPDALTSIVHRENVDEFLL